MTFVLCSLFEKLHYDFFPPPSFCLNTSVELPHEGGVTALAFQPSPDPQQQLAVTAGCDFKFRMWGLAESTSIYSMYKWSKQDGPCHS